MAWFYEIRDSNNVVAKTMNGFATRTEAMSAGRKKARELKASGMLLSGGAGSVVAVQCTEVVAK